MEREEPIDRIAKLKEEIDRVLFAADMNAMADEIMALRAQEKNDGR